MSEFEEFQDEHFVALGIGCLAVGIACLIGLLTPLGLLSIGIGSMLTGLVFIRIGSGAA